MTPFPFEIKKQSWDLYEQGLSAAQISERLNGPTASCITRWVREVGLSRGHKEAGRLRNFRTYKLDENFFKKPLTPASAWLLGLIVGDGCVIRNIGKNGNPDRLCGVELLGDEDVCRKACLILGSDAPVHDCQTDPKPSKVHEVRLYSPALAESLAAFGVTPNKSRIVPWPVSLPADLESHFIRGLWDSDGCVTTTKRGSRAYLALSFVSCSKELTEGVLERVHRVTGSKANLSLAKDETYHLSLSCKKAIGFGNWIWSTSTPEIRGDRKHDLFVRLRDRLDHAAQRAGKSKWDAVRAQVLDFYKQGQRPAEISDTFGVSKKAIERWIRQDGIGRGKSENMKLAWGARGAA